MKVLFKICDQCSSNDPVCI